MLFLQDFIAFKERVQSVKIEDIKIWESFLAVAKQGHFSRAAGVLGVPLPQVSKRVTKLEEGLGLRLFHRTTRSVSLTDEGKVLLPKIESLMADLVETEHYFEKNKSFSGAIKITSVPFVAHRLLLPVLPLFADKYPQIKIELEVSEKMLNLVESGFDIALRIDTPKDSDLVYRKLAPNDLIFCASPAYLKKAGKLKGLDDLKKHSLLALSIHNRCRFKKIDKKVGDFSSAKTFICENGAFLTDMAVAGGGVLLRSIWDVQEYLKTKKLVQVLENYPLETFGHIYAVVPTRRYVAPRVRAFLDFIFEESKKW
ncbi:MAG: LysR family transcriptional regulator [Bdellovibrionota bacterium]